MNILFITLYPLELNSSVSVSSKSIIRGLISLGHRVTIIMPNGEHGQLEEDINALQIIRIPGKMKPLSKRYIVNKIHSKLEIFDFKAHGFLKESRHIDIPQDYFDVILSVSDPLDSHLFAKKLIKNGLKYGKWIQHWGDPVYGNISHKLLWPKVVIRLYESKIIRRADKVVYVTPFSSQVQKEIHKKYQSKIFFTPLPVDCISENEMKAHNGLKIAYVGDYCKYIRNIRPLYEACSQLENVELTIAGYGIPLPSLNNIHVFSRVPYDKARQIEDESDILVGICNLHGTQIPGKIFYKSGSNKHILVAIEEEHKEEMKSYFESFKRYTICDNEVKSIKLAIQGLKDKSSKYLTPTRLLPENVVSEILI